MERANTENVTARRSGLKSREDTWQALKLTSQISISNASFIKLFKISRMAFYNIIFFAFCKYRPYIFNFVNVVF